MLSLVVFVLTMGILLYILAPYFIPSDVLEIIKKDYLLEIAFILFIPLTQLLAEENLNHDFFKESIIIKHSHIILLVHSDKVGIIDVFKIINTQKEVYKDGIILPVPEEVESLKITGLDNKHIIKEGKLVYNGEIPQGEVEVALEYEINYEGRIKEIKIPIDNLTKGDLIILKEGEGEISGLNLLKVGEKGFGDKIYYIYKVENIGNYKEYSLNIFKSYNNIQDNIKKKKVILSSLFALSFVILFLYNYGTQLGKFYGKIITSNKFQGELQ